MSNAANGTNGETKTLNKTELAQLQKDCKAFAAIIKAREELDNQREALDAVEQELAVRLYQLVGSARITLESSGIDAMVVRTDETPENAPEGTEPVYSYHMRRYGAPRPRYVRYNPSQAKAKPRGTKFSVNA